MMISRGWGVISDDYPQIVMGTRLEDYVINKLENKCAHYDSDLGVKRCQNLMT